uniref:Tetratricopeptide repeat protein n=1 Tax=Desulfobacca acetoxidans TaxID=60893 RepID=A0A7V4G7C8_9BACT
MRKVVKILWTAALWGSLVLAASGAWAQNPEAQKFMAEGGQHLEKGQFDQAIALYKKAIAKEPRSAVAYNMLGMAYRFKYNQVRSQDLKNQEIAAFQKAIEIDPNYWVALINLGVTYNGLGDKAKAAPLFKKALTLKPDHPERAELEKIIKEGEKKK